MPSPAASSQALNETRTIELLAIERRYWADRSVDWGIVTEREVPPVLLRNLEFLQGYASVDDLKQPFEGYFHERTRLFSAEVEGCFETTLQGLRRAMDVRLGLDPGGTQMLVRYLLASKTWFVDMMQPIVETMQMGVFKRGADRQDRRAQA